MGLYKKHIADGVNFNYLETGKFKTGFLSVNFIAPLDAATAAKNALIPAILMRGSEQYPNMAEINKKLDYLYASGMSSRNNKRGELQIFGMIVPVNTAHYPGITPNTERSLYSLMHTKNPAKAKAWVAPLGTSGLYMLDECCKVDNVVYRSIVDNNAYSPADYAANWEVAT